MASSISCCLHRIHNAASSTVQGTSCSRRRFFGGWFSPDPVTPRAVALNVSVAQLLHSRKISSSPTLLVQTKLCTHQWNLTSTLQTSRRQMLSDLALPKLERPNKCKRFRDSANVCDVLATPVRPYATTSQITISPACYHSSPATKCRKKTKNTSNNWIITPLTLRHGLPDGQAVHGLPPTTRSRTISPPPSSAVVFRPAR